MILYRPVSDTKLQEQVVVKDKKEKENSPGINILTL